MFGERHLKYTGEMIFRDDNNNLECIVKVDPSVEKSMFTKMLKSKPSIVDEVYGNLTQNGSIIDRCEGQWLSHLDWFTLTAKRKNYWKLSKKNCVWPIAVSNSLESDCSKRSDLIALRKAEANEEDELLHDECVRQSQENKVALEEVQRADAKLRKEGLEPKKI